MVVRHARVAVVAALMLTSGAFVSAARAQSVEQQWTYCQNENDQYAPDLAIGGCTAIIRSGIVTSTDLAVVFVYRGLAYSTQGDNARAILDYDQALRIDPQTPTALNNRGFSYYWLRDYARAIADFDQAIRNNPQDVDAVMNRAVAYLQTGDYARAIAGFEESARLVGNDTPLFGRGIARLRLGQTEAGQTDINTQTAAYADIARVYESRWGIRP